MLVWCTLHQLRTRSRFGRSLRAITSGQTQSCSFNHCQCMSTALCMAGDSSLSLRSARTRPAYDRRAMSAPTSLMKPHIGIALVRLAHALCAASSPEMSGAIWLSKSMSRPAMLHVPAISSEQDLVATWCWVEPWSYMVTQCTNSWLSITDRKRML